MAYIKFKEVTKYFNFSRVIDKKKLPDYIYDYVFEDEKILSAYKTSRDHGAFTTKKIVLFDNYSLFGIRKEISIIPYTSISACSIIFEHTKAELSLFLDCGYQMRLKFINMKPIDKRRLRILYTHMLRISNNQKPNEVDIKNLIDDNIIL